MKTYTDEEYLRYDPFEGDRDTDYKLRSAKLVKIRKPAMCFGNGDSGAHLVEKGTRVRSEAGIVDGEWMRCVVCLMCIAEWFNEIGE